jgi:hypothetical protein
VLCLDLDGFLFSGTGPLPGMVELVAELRANREVVVTTAAPADHAEGALRQSGFPPLRVFAELLAPRGKQYTPVARAYPEASLVAAGHSPEDLPADLDIPFVFCDVPDESMSAALRLGLAHMLGERVPDHPGLSVSEGSLDTGALALSRVVMVGPAS